MKTMAVGELKAKFSEVLDEVRRGHPIAVGYGKRKKRIAVIVPYDQYERISTRKLGVLEERGTYCVKEGFTMTDAELLES